MSCLIRPCSTRDLKKVMRLVWEIAGIYKVPPGEVKTSEEALTQAGFGDPPLFECFVAQLPPGQTTPEGHSIVGYVLSSYTYSTWRGRSLYIDNLYVQPPYRDPKDPGIWAPVPHFYPPPPKDPGIWALVPRSHPHPERTHQAAVAQGCFQLRMHVANDKPESEAFLARRGGRDLTRHHAWALGRFPPAALARLAAGTQVFGGRRG
ncbi:diamine acetyltransferase 2-like [Alligator sinensis]|uniref:Diamine acetyltransferase 2-like n=1 Tax=Alligator sinensis TaxID=38654 RepID=A0A3Q0FQG5_ALLSI|nr:diamine acetyltransferase 2-like [Alligator sinensis]